MAISPLRLEGDRLSFHVPKLAQPFAKGLPPGKSRRVWSGVVQKPNTYGPLRLLRFNGGRYEEEASTYRAEKGSSVHY